MAVLGSEYRPVSWTCRVALRQRPLFVTHRDASLGSEQAPTEYSSHRIATSAASHRDAPDHGLASIPLRCAATIETNGSIQTSIGVLYCSRHSQSNPHRYNSDALKLVFRMSALMGAYSPSAHRRRDFPRISVAITEKRSSGAPSGSRTVRCSGVHWTLRTCRVR